MEEKELLQEISEAVEYGDFYEWVANNYYKLDKEQLKEIILNLDYAIHTEREEDLKRIENKMVDELRDRI